MSKPDEWTMTKLRGIETVLRTAPKVAEDKLREIAPHMFERADDPLGMRLAAMHGMITGIVEGAQQDLLALIEVLEAPPKRTITGRRSKLRPV